MSDTCLNCNGLIAEPGVTYGYAGKFCHCPKDPFTQFQRPASKEGVMVPSPAETFKKELREATTPKSPQNTHEQTGVGANITNHESQSVKHPPRRFLLAESVDNDLATIAHLVPKNFNVGEDYYEFLSETEHEAAIAELKAELKIQDDANEILSRQLTHFENQIDKLKSQLAEKDAEIESWKNAVERLDARLERTLEENRNLQQRLERSEATYELAKLNHEASIAILQSRLAEEHRLNGMGTEREAALMGKLAVAERALEFYSIPDDYVINVRTPISFVSIQYTETKVFKDRGETAREALAKIKGEVK